MVNVMVMVLVSVMVNVMVSVMVSVLVSVMVNDFFRRKKDMVILLLENVFIVKYI